MNEQLDNKLITKSLEDTKIELKDIIHNDGFWQEFITTLKFDHFDQNKIIINVKNLFAKQILNTDFIKPITKILSKHLNQNVDIVFKVVDEIYTPTPTTSFVVANPNISSVNKNYTFDNFIVTDFNKAAFNAAQSIFKKIY
jgi:chromosomal replication initiation ATPase DnaA